MGIPASHSFCNIVANVLSRLIESKEGILEDFLACRNKVRVTHLKFVDNIIIFSRAKKEDMYNLKLILWLF